MAAPSPGVDHRLAKRAPEPLHINIRIKPLHLHIEPKIHIHIDAAKKLKLERCIRNSAKRAPGKVLHIMIDCIPKAIFGGAGAFGTCCAVSGAISAAVATAHIVECMKH